MSGNATVLTTSLGKRDHGRQKSPPWEPGKSSRASEQHGAPLRPFPCSHGCWQVDRQLGQCVLLLVPAGSALWRGGVEGEEGGMWDQVAGLLSKNCQRR